MILFPESVNNFIFIGESGSGKSEISVAFACHLAQTYSRQVDIFDMDQTKPLFRSRDYLRKLDLPNLHLHFQEQILDSPLAVPGIIESLSNKEIFTIVDVGGNTIGARMIAPYSHQINNPSTITWFIVNPYRPWSRNKKVLSETIAQLSAHSKINNFYFLSNPTLGPDTSINQVVEGHKTVVEMVSPHSVLALCVEQKLADQLNTKIAEPVFPIQLSNHRENRI